MGRSDYNGNMFDEATQLKIAYIYWECERREAAEKQAAREKQAAAEEAMWKQRIAKFHERMGYQTPYWTKIARIAPLLRLARLGKASAPQLAQLEHKLHAGNQRMLGTLTKNPKDPNAVYEDVRNKFQDIGRSSPLGARIKHLNAFGPNASWDIVTPHVARFQRDFRAIKGNMTANGQNPWADNAAVAYARQQMKDRAKVSTVNPKKLLQHTKLSLPYCSGWGTSSRAKSCIFLSR